MEEILRFICETEDEVYLVGGFVRDGLLGRRRGDADFVCQRPLELAERVSERFKGHRFFLKQEAGLVRVTLAGSILDFSPIKGTTLEEDLRSRDFTFNAMAIKVRDYLKSGFAGLVDPCGGIDDLDRQVLRAVRPSSLRDDPVRVLRGLRFEGYLGFSPDGSTRAAMREASPLLRTSLPERIREEFYKILALPVCRPVIEEMFSVGALEAFFPELAGLAGVEQNHHHRENAWIHSLGALQAMEEILRGRTLPAGLREKMERYVQTGLSGGIVVGQMLKFVALVHDLGKKETSFTREDGRISFLGHDLAGAKTFDRAGRRMRLSKEELRRIGRLIELHMRPLQLFHTGLASDRAIHRLFKAAGEDRPGLLLLALADGMSTAREHPGGEIAVDYKNFLLDLVKKAVFEETKFLPTPLVDGETVMRELGILPGNRVGAVLEQLVLAQVEGRVKSKEEAIDFLRERRP